MKRILYLGSDPSQFSSECTLVHYPVIKIVPCVPKSLFDNWHHCTHIILTSKHGARIFAESLKSAKKTVASKEIIVVGRVTALALEKEGMRATQIAEIETQEGIIALLERTPPSRNSFFLLPRSSRSRAVLADFLKASGYPFEAVDLYHTHLQKPGPLPDLNAFDEIIFTSPSTVRGFERLEPIIPELVQLTAIGPITRKVLKKSFKEYDRVRNIQGDKNVRC
jgi:uroporphyrinogen-III synthase